MHDLMQLYLVRVHLYKLHVHNAPLQETLEWNALCAMYIHKVYVHSMEYMYCIVVWAVKPRKTGVKTWSNKANPRSEGVSKSASFWSKKRPFLRGPKSQNTDHPGIWSQRVGGIRDLSIN